MQVDPIGYEDQVNLYAYVGNDPMNKVDPKGTCTKQANSKSNTPSDALCRTTESLKTSDKGKQFTKEREGKVGSRGKPELTVYRDTKGNPTVGWGHKVTPTDNLKVGDTISTAQAQSLFDADIATAESAVRKAAGGTELSQREFDALTDQAFQGGARSLGDKSPALSTALQNGDYQKIAEEMDYGEPGRYTQRQEMFITGNYDPWP